jgi:hypothetical protein
MRPAVGRVYVLSNKAMPGLLKIWRLAIRRRGSLGRPALPNEYVPAEIVGRWSE